MILIDIQETQSLSCQIRVVKTFTILIKVWNQEVK